MNIAEKIWNLAHDQAKHRWDAGEFDQVFRLKSDDRPEFKEGYAEITLNVYGELMVKVTFPSPCGCCPDDETYFHLGFLDNLVAKIDVAEDDDCDYGARMGI